MSTTTARLIELDVLRGLAVAGMILVVSPGDWGAAYPQLQHAEWNGWTLADMVFPTFLFGVGIALALSFPRAWRTAADRRSFWGRALRRAALLIVLGLALEATYNWTLPYTGGTLGKPGLAYLRIPGILQRIALCYLLAAAAVVGTARRDAAGRLTIRPGAVAAVALAVLLAYWAVLVFVPTPGFGAGRLDPAGYLGGYIDRAVFGVPHLWPLGWAYPGGPAVYDPEGLLSTVPATTNVLFGVLAGWLWRHRADRAALVLGVAGGALIAAGLLLGPLFPINKRMWTSSFALFGAGFGAVLLAALLLTGRSRTTRAVLSPFRILGANAILAFIVSTLLGRIYDLPLVASGGARLPLRGWLDQKLLWAVGDPHLAATGCAVLFVALIVVLLMPLQKRAMHVRL